MMYFFTLKEGRKWWQEVRDQILHAVYAAIMFLIAFHPIPALIAGLLSFAFGILRELEQKKWDWKRMGKQDLFFWGAASLAMALAYGWGKI